jgi:predicted PurR-regulated permease PerM
MVLLLARRPGQEELLLMVSIVLAIILAYLILPLLDGMVLGVVFAYVGRPVRALFGGRRRLGALAATFCIAVPLSLIFAQGLMEGAGQLAWLEGNQAKIMEGISEFVSGLHITQAAYLEMLGSLQNMAGLAAQLLANIPLMIGRALSLGIINFLIAFFVCYFLLLDGARIKEMATAFLSPESELSRCLVKTDLILSGIYVGSIYTAIAGGITSVAIFYIFGVPRPLAMACIVFLAGMVPFLTWLVFIPTAISRYLSFGATDAILFFLAGSILVHLVELVIRPTIVHAKSSLHPLLVLLTFLGGGLVAGIAGFFLAPAMVALVMGALQVMRNGQDAQGISNPHVETDNRA